MKKCSKCGLLLEETEFNYKNKAKAILRAQCRACSKQECKDHYNANKELYFDRNLKKINQCREFVISEKNKPCMDCGKTYPYYVMDFDHRDSATKRNCVSMMTRHSSIATLKAEIAKCDLVCANCHRIRTFKESGT